MVRRLIYFVFVFITSNCFAQPNSGYSVYTDVEQRPQPPADIEKYLVDSLRYPDFALRNNVQGKVPVRFIVTHTGNIDSVKIVGSKRIGYGLEAEAIRLVKAMSTWTPGMQNGTAVNAYETLPVVFRIKIHEPQIQESDTGLVYKLEGITLPYPDYDFEKYLAANLNYPPEAWQNQIEGKVQVRFIVTEKGKIESVSTISPVIGVGLEQEAMRLVRSMPRWKPGTQYGKPIRTYFTQPISFRLADRDASH